MKLYTDLPQSRTLGEFLPHTTADQTWERAAIAGASLDVPEELQYRHKGDMPFRIYSGIGVPCWSLAALLDTLDDVVVDDEGNEYYLTISKEEGMYYINYHDRWEKVDDIETLCYYDLVDACYAMIIKLHELNML